MRVTLNGLTLNFLRNVNQGLERLSTLQETMATGKRVRAPSDDPTSLPSILSLRGVLAGIVQYARNANDTQTMLRSGEQALGDALQIAHRMRELAVQGANATLSAADLRAIRIEVDGLLDQAVALGNTSVAGRYVLAGTRTTQAPFVRVGNTVTYQGNADPLLREVDAGVALSAAIPGDVAFVVGQDGLFPAASRLLSALAAGDHDAVRTEITSLDRAVDMLTSAQATLGARAARVELVQTRLGELDVQFAELLSSREDADIARTIMELRMQETAYQAALNGGARLLPPTLLDFLR